MKKPGKKPGINTAFWLSLLEVALLNRIVHELFSQDWSDSG